MMTWTHLTLTQKLAALTLSRTDLPTAFLRSLFGRQQIERK